MASKKKKVSIGITTENYAFLRWLKLNYQDSYSWVTNNLLSKYREKMTEGMTEHERKMIQSLKEVVEASIFDREKIEQLRIEAFDLAFEERLMDLIADDEKRIKIRELLDLADNK